MVYWQKASPPAALSSTCLKACCRVMGHLDCHTGVRAPLRLPTSTPRALPRWMERCSSFITFWSSSGKWWPDQTYCTPLRQRASTQSASPSPASEAFTSRSKPSWPRRPPSRLS